MSGLTFTGCTSENGCTEVHYELMHSDAALITTLRLDLKLTIVDGKFYAEFTDCKTAGDTAEEALDKLEDWLERAAEAIRARGEPKTLICDYSQYGEASCPV